MSKTITIAQWQKYLNKKTGGFQCPICHRTDWQTQQDQNGNVLEINVSDHQNSLQTNSEGAIDLGGIEDSETKDDRPGSRLQRSILIRCGHCGFIALFDREFVEDELYD